MAEKVRLLVPDLGDFSDVEIMVKLALGAPLISSGVTPVYSLRRIITWDVNQHVFRFLMHTKRRDVIILDRQLAGLNDRHFPALLQCHLPSCMDNLNYVVIII